MARPRKAGENENRRKAMANLREEGRPGSEKIEM